MPDTRLDVIGIGNAFVDVLSKSDDAFLADNGLDKGIMTLIDADQAERIYSRMGPGVEVSGGSAANTIAGLAALGWFEPGAPAVEGVTRAHTTAAVRIRRSRFRWTRFQLSDGSFARLVETVARPGRNGPGRTKLAR